MRKIYVLCFIFVLSLVACQRAKESQIEKSEQKPEKLIVYAVGDRIGGNTNPDSYYCTNYTVGPFGPVVDAIGEKGYIYQEAFQNFEQETGIKLDIKYFSYMGEVEAQILDDRENGALPDVLIMDQRMWGAETKIDNIYRIMAQEWFYDLKPYVDQDELYISGNYYEQVLEAGIYQNEQLVLPLSFNIKTIFTSKQEMEDMGVFLYPEMNGQEIVEQLQEACIRARKGEVAIDTLSLWSSITAIIPVLWESTGLEPVDYETQTVTLDQDLFEELAIFIQTYFQQDMQESWEAVVKNASSYLAPENWSLLSAPKSAASLDNQRDTIHMMKEEAKAWLENGSFYIESNSESMYRHGFAGQCMALDTLYDESQEEMQMIGIPMYEENDAYIAEVQMLGGVMKESESPYYAYELLKFILDHDYTPYYSVSVSKKITSDMLDELEKTTYTLYLALGNFWDEDVDLSKEREEYQYTLNPLKKERREQIDDLLDHIAGAVLPQCSIYEPISWHLQAYALEYETMEEAYEGACQDLEEWLLFTVGE